MVCFSIFWFGRMGAQTISEYNRQYRTGNETIFGL